MRKSKIAVAAPTNHKTGLKKANEKIGKMEEKGFELVDHQVRQNGEFIMHFKEPV